MINLGRLSRGHCIVLTAFVVFQTLNSIVDFNRWPFSSYNMFNQAFANPVIVDLELRAKMVGETYTFDANRAFPIEFFNSEKLMLKILKQTRGQSGQEKVERFLSRYIRFLETHNWSAFDETAARPLSREQLKQIRSLELESVLVDTSGDHLDRRVQLGIFQKQ
ncbi:MAG: hypothetical protein HRT45_18350 [Bdellovibrionales bacterium]|nr:hypothetical protein [Bdellovibrionales bacterium]